MIKTYLVLLIFMSPILNPALAGDHEVINSVHEQKPQSSYWSYDSIDFVNDYNCDIRLNQAKTAFSESAPNLGSYCQPQRKFQLMEQFLGPKTTMPFLTSVTDAVKAEVFFNPNLQRFYAAKFNMKTYKPIEFYVGPNYFGDQNSVKTKLFLHKNKKSDLIIYLPGVFQGLDDVYTLKMLDLMDMQGYHVLVIPNGLSEDYQDRIPYDCGGNFEREASLVNIITARAKNLLADKIDKVNLVGVSYGGFLASVAAAKSKDGLYDGDITLLGPQLNLANSIRYLDSMNNKNILLDGAKKIIGHKFNKGLVTFNERLLNIYEDQKNADGQPNSLFLRDTDIADKENAISTYEEFNNNNNFDTYLDNISFVETMNKLCPELKSLYAIGSQKSELKYWLSQSLPLKARVLMSIDDYSRPPTESFQWAESFPESYLDNQRNILIRKNGGHNGFVNTDWFTDFIKRSFPKQ